MFRLKLRLCIDRFENCLAAVARLLMSNWYLKISSLCHAILQYMYRVSVYVTGCTIDYNRAETAVKFAPKLKAKA